MEEQPIRTDCTGVRREGFFYAIMNCMPGPGTLREEGCLCRSVTNSPDVSIVYAPEWRRKCRYLKN